MKYELNVLEKLIVETIQPSALQARSPIAVSMREAVKIFCKEKERLRKAFMEAFYKCTVQHVFALYIGHHQQELIRFSNIIYSYQQNCTDAAMKLAYHNCMSHIEDLLTMMQHDFKEYFILTNTGTQYFSNITEPIIKKDSVALKKLFKQINIDETLQQIVIAVFEEYRTDKNVCTYHRYFYLEQLYKKMIRIQDEKILIACLYEMNFNSILFFKYYILYIKTLFSDTHSTDTTMLLLASYIKENNQHLLYNNCALYPEEISIKTMVGKYWEDELYFLELQEPKTNYATATQKKGKIKINISVEALAYFLFLFEESGMVEATVKKQIFELVANHCSSKEQMNIAYKSLQNSSYDISAYTKNKVKDILIKMVNLVNRKN